MFAHYPHLTAIVFFILSSSPSPIFFDVLVFRIPRGYLGTDQEGFEDLLEYDMWMCDDLMAYPDGKWGLKPEA